MTDHQANELLSGRLEQNRQLEQLFTQNLWYLGDLTYKFKDCQLRMHEDIETSGHMKYVIKCSRRLGKTYYLVSRGTMKCLRKPGALVRFAAPEQGSLTTLLRPIMNIIMKDIPEDLRPRWSVKDSAYIFHI